MFLKGGILMGLVHDSPRQTTDIDLTTALAAEGGVGDAPPESCVTNFRAYLYMANSHAIGTNPKDAGESILSIGPECDAAPSS